MEVKTSIVIQTLLLSLALAFTILRCWVRLCREHRHLTIADYILWVGWFFTLGWVTCSIKGFYMLRAHPLAANTPSDSASYLKLLFVSVYFFDLGLYWPKFSLVAFYWWLIPHGFKRLRKAVYLLTAFLSCAILASLVADTMLAPHIEYTWFTDPQSQLETPWNFITSYTLNWAMNLTSDVLLFCLPFFMIHRLNLRRRQKIGLVVVFSLGLITIAISLARFIVYRFNFAKSVSAPSDVPIAVSASTGMSLIASGNTWCTAEMCTSVIVVSLPALKSLVVRETPKNTSNRSTNGYIQTNSDSSIGNKSGTTRSHIQGGKMEDEMELVSLDRKPSPSPTGATSELNMHDRNNDAVMVTTDVMIAREAI